MKGGSKMGKSIAGYWLALIGGILGVIGGIMLMFGGGFLVALYSAMNVPLLTGAITAFYIILGTLAIVFNVLIIIGGVWMKESKTCKKGALFALIFGILASFNILAIIAGILGLIAAK